MDALSQPLLPGDDAAEVAPTQGKGPQRRANGCNKPYQTVQAVEGARATPKEGDLALPHDWDSPAYERLRAHGLLRTTWRVRSVNDLIIREGNTTPALNVLRYMLSCFCPPLFCCLQTAEVPAGCIRKMEDGRGGFEFLGNRGPLQGIHAYWDPFYRIEPANLPISNACDANGVAIVNGDLWLVVVPQGFVGMAQDMGQPVLLPPGMHQWRSSTMKFARNIDLNQPVIQMGPYTLLTVDKGYDAVTQNNGMQQVLPGGAVHLLNHRNWKFEKFITCKIQTDDLQRVEVLTGDNVLMHVDATVCWSITDAQRCAERAAETMQGEPGRPDAHTLLKLRNDVLKQAEASLSALVGKTTFSAAFSAATAMQVTTVASVPLVHGVDPAAGNGSNNSNATNNAANAAANAANAAANAAVAAMTPAASSSAAPPSTGAQGVPVEMETAALLFDVDKLSCAIAHANDMTTRYGVQVLSINIISAKPADDVLMTCLAQGAVAAAQAQQLETIARGRAKAVIIEAKAAAEALRVSAAAEAAAAITRADGNAAAASTLATQPVAVRLATMSANAEAMKHSRSSLILGQNASSISNILLSVPGDDGRAQPDADDGSRSHALSNSVVYPLPRPPTCSPTYAPVAATPPMSAPTSAPSNAPADAGGQQPPP